MHASSWGMGYGCFTMGSPDHNQIARRSVQWWMGAKGGNGGTAMHGMLGRKNREREHARFAPSHPLVRPEGHTKDRGETKSFHDHAMGQR